MLHSVSVRLIGCKVVADLLCNMQGWRIYIFYFIAAEASHSCQMQASPVKCFRLASSSHRLAPANTAARSDNAKVASKPSRARARASALLQSVRQLAKKRQPHDGAL
jgi:hypothetical protein